MSADVAADIVRRAARMEREEAARAGMCLVLELQQPRRGPEGDGGAGAGAASFQLAFAPCPGTPCHAAAACRHPQVRITFADAAASVGVAPLAQFRLTPEHDAAVAHTIAKSCLSHALCEYLVGGATEDGYTFGPEDNLVVRLGRLHAQRVLSLEGICLAHIGHDPGGAAEEDDDDEAEPAADPPAPWGADADDHGDDDETEESDPEDEAVAAGPDAAPAPAPAAPPAQVPPPPQLLPVGGAADLSPNPFDELYETGLRDLVAMCCRVGG